VKFIDLCAGIGGFRLGLELAGHKCIGFCEKDKFAVKSYRAMFDTKGEWYRDDVTTIKPEEIPYADIWTFGFPCQDISVAGKQRGLVGKRSGIYFNIVDLVKGKEEKDKPTFLLIENVKNLLSINRGFDFATVLSELSEAGYDAKWQVLNSKDFGVPQNRERVFIVANLRSRGRREILPLTGENTAALKQVIGGMQGYRVYNPEGI
jgi:DNA (cytosine-5)-methyltransferase 1